jgi:hypothetical protein
VAAYQIKLDNGTLIYADEDNDDHIRRKARPAVAPVRKKKLPRNGRASLEASDSLAGRIDQQLCVNARLSAIVDDNALLAPLLTRDKQRALQWLTLRDLSQCAVASRAFRQLADHDEVWEPRFPRVYLPYSRQTLTWKAEYKVWYRRHHFPRDRGSYRNGTVAPARPASAKDRVSYRDAKGCWPNTYGSLTSQRFLSSQKNELQQKLRNFFADLPFYDATQVSDYGMDADTIGVEWATHLWHTMNGDAFGEGSPKGLEHTSWWLGTGVTRCAVELLQRHTEREWLELHPKMPYYLCALLGSIVHMEQPHAHLKQMEAEGALAVLMPILHGSLTWAEQRVAARGLGHLCKATAPEDGLFHRDGDSIHVEALRMGAAPALAHLLARVDDVCITSNVIHPSRSGHWQSDLLLANQGMFSSSAQMRCNYLQRMNDAKAFAKMALHNLVTGTQTCMFGEECAQPGVLGCLVEMLLRTHGGSDCADAEEYNKSWQTAISLIESICTDHGVVDYVNGELRTISPKNGGIPIRAPMICGAGVHRFILPFVHQTSSSCNCSAVSALRGLAAVPRCQEHLWRDGVHLFLLPLLAQSAYPEKGGNRPATKYKLGDSQGNGGPSTCLIAQVVTTLKLLAGVPGEGCAIDDWRCVGAVELALSKLSQDGGRDSAAELACARQDLRVSQAAIHAALEDGTSDEEAEDVLALQRRGLEKTVKKLVKEQRQKVQENKDDAGGLGCPLPHIPRSVSQDPQCKLHLLGCDMSSLLAWTNEARSRVLRTVLLALHALRKAEDLAHDQAEAVRLQVAARELKDQGNQYFQTKEYASALGKYMQALGTLPQTAKADADRAVFLSNAAESSLKLAELADSQKPLLPGDTCEQDHWLQFGVDVEATSRAGHAFNAFCASTAALSVVWCHPKATVRRLRALKILLSEQAPPLPWAKHFFDFLDGPPNKHRAGQRDGILLGTSATKFKMGSKLTKAQLAVHATRYLQQAELPPAVPGGSVGTKKADEALGSPPSAHQAHERSPLCWDPRHSWLCVMSLDYDELCVGHGNRADASTAPVSRATSKEKKSAKKADGLQVTMHAHLHDWSRELFIRRGGARAVSEEYLGLWDPAISEAGPAFDKQACNFVCTMSSQAFSCHHQSELYKNAKWMERLAGQNPLRALLFDEDEVGQSECDDEGSVTHGWAMKWGFEEGARRLSAHDKAVDESCERAFVRAQEISSADQ